MPQEFCLIITSVSGPENKVLQLYAKECDKRQLSFILAGDISSPVDFKLKGCDFLSVKDQQDLPFELPKLLPHKHYSKKNAAYLKAILNGHGIIVETDDDNLPYDAFWTRRDSIVEGHVAEAKEWLNVYAHFSIEEIWPRGFPLKKISDGECVLSSEHPVRVFSPVQQTLTNENPDVDAIYRLACKLPISFNKRTPVLLSAGSTCPFNSQNTTWFCEAFPLMYLPSYCSFRMCDIWRSFVAQRIMWENDWSLSFHEPNMFQQRNEHDLLKDLSEEISGYLFNPGMVNDLRALTLKKGKEFLGDNLLKCYQALVRQNYLPASELTLVEAWVRDLNSLAAQIENRPNTLH